MITKFITLPSENKWKSLNNLKKIAESFSVRSESMIFIAPEVLNFFCIKEHQ